MIARIERWLYVFSKRLSRRNLYPWLSEAIAAHGLAQGKRVLSVGAGGEIGAFVKSLGVTCTSIDNDPRRNPDLLLSVEDLSSLSDGSFDAVLCMEVLEHVVSPQTAFTEMVRVLRPGGVLIGSTPFLLGIHDAPFDFQRFTRHGIERLAEGLETLALRERNTYFAAIAVLVSRRFVIGSARERRSAWYLSPALLAVIGICQLLDQFLPASDGTTGYFWVFRNPPQW